MIVWLGDKMSVLDWLADVSMKKLKEYREIAMEVKEGRGVWVDENESFLGSLIEGGKVESLDRLIRIKKAMK